MPWQNRFPRLIFEAPELLFVGYSRRHEAFCKQVYDAWTERGAKVYPVNPKPEDFSVKVYGSLKEVPVRSIFAYVLTGKGTTAEMLDELAERGVKKLLFQSKASVRDADLARCADLGMAAEIACPLMAFGKGFHRFHGFFAGVKKAEKTGRA